MAMFNRDDWAQVLVPKETKEEIREAAKIHGLKIWQVVDQSLQELKSKQASL
jgi:LDH2 family malate/lactate/ureidoglycolate dehydrogenase